MKYLTYELIAAANGWNADSNEEYGVPEAGGGEEFERAVDAYRRELDSIKSRISTPAFKFFRYGRGETGIHDGRLISMSIGDGVTKRDSRFSGVRNSTEAIITVINFEEDREHVFRLKGVSGANLALVGSQFGDIYLCELTAVDDDKLKLSFLFADGHEIGVEFRKLIYRLKKLN